jgi:hypothetical protein
VGQDRRGSALGVVLGAGWWIGYNVAQGEYEMFCVD